MADNCETTPGCKGYVPYEMDRTEKYVPAYTVDGKPACADCYFEKLGELVEKHPIGRHSAHGCVVSPDD